MIAQFNTAMIECEIFKTETGYTQSEYRRTTA